MIANVLKGFTRKINPLEHYFFKKIEPCEKGLIKIIKLEKFYFEAI
jgi:hypothetical protein